MSRIFHDNRGMTLIELVVTMVILSILGAMIIPSAQLTNRRTKEIELRRELREIRGAIDDYKRYYDKALAEGKIQKVEGKSGYPETLKVLVDGEDFGGVLPVKVKFLRRIPQDPFHPVKAGTKEEDTWHLRGYSDEPDSQWGGKDVYDVSSLSEETAIDGTKYKDW